MALLVADEQRSLAEKVKSTAWPPGAKVLARYRKKG
jgi:hypothetical protein